MEVCYKYVTLKSRVWNLNHQLAWISGVKLHICHQYIFWLWHICHKQHLKTLVLNFGLQNGINGGNQHICHKYIFSFQLKSPLLKMEISRCLGLQYISKTWVNFCCAVAFDNRAPEKSFLLWLRTFYIWHKFFKKGKLNFIFSNVQETQVNDWLTLQK